MLSVQVLVHLQDSGDETGLKQLTPNDNITPWYGTKGQSRRLEGFEIRFPGDTGLEADLEYFAHLENVGDTSWTPAGTFVGTRGQSRRLEGFGIRFKPGSPHEKTCCVRYRAHVENYGDSCWFSDGDFAGTRGESLRCEAIQIQIEVLPDYAYALTYHLQDIGDVCCTGNLSDVVTYGSSQTPWCGTKGESRRLEGLQINFLNMPEIEADLEYMAHLQDTGDTAWVQGGHFLGTRGESRRLEGFAVRFKPGSRSSEIYALQYRCHVQNIGDGEWCQEGQFAGTRGQALRLEAFQIELTLRHARVRRSPVELILAAAAAAAALAAINFSLVAAVGGGRHPSPDDDIHIYLTDSQRYKRGIEALRNAMRGTWRGRVVVHRHFLFDTSPIIVGMDPNNAYVVSINGQELDEVNYNHIRRPTQVTFSFISSYLENPNSDFGIVALCTIIAEAARFDVMADIVMRMIDQQFEFEPVDYESLRSQWFTNWSSRVGGRTWLMWGLRPPIDPLRKFDF
eukprot:TRINITY_DN47454_c0_g1_i1.p1 TRINITY_DN47454_c0_g1~~TRINITY_DN47454_c0_g1_i1.p1  ORF type:complete len:510 (-),score=81.78 TRINITY_DN47454_c0_g1_i1:275-1804(-)